MNSSDLKIGEFFSWCKANGLAENEDIAIAFSLSVQTIRNWRKLHRNKAKEYLPHWVSLACVAIENKAKFSVYTFDDFHKWRRKFGLLTYEEAGAAFNVKRQTIHQWYRRGRIPQWVPLACAGYEFQKIP